MINTKETIKDFISLIERYSIKNVLDLGCGKGRISLGFAKKGINVIGVDKRKLVFNQNNFEFISKNIKEFDFLDKYDLIISSLVLHFLKRNNAIDIIKRMMRSTPQNGFNLLICLSDKDDCKKEKPDNFYPDLKEIKQIYSGWEILKELQDFTEIEDHDGLGTHRHNIIFLLARKKLEHPNLSS